MTRKGKVILIILGIIVLLPLLWKYGYDFQFKNSENLGPSITYILGTDYLGRDILLRLLVAFSVSFFIGVISAFTTTCIGFILGTISAQKGGWVDAIIMGITDIFYVVPSVLVVIILQIIFYEVNIIKTNSLWGSIWPMIVSFSLLYWMSFARVVRATVLSLKTQEFYQVSVSFGGNSFHILKYHIIPCMTKLLLTNFIIQIPNIVVSEAFFSFIGLGIPPNIPSIGGLISEYMNSIYSYPFRAIYPIIALILLIIFMKSLSVELLKKQSVLESA